MVLFIKYNIARRLGLIDVNSPRIYIVLNADPAKNAKAGVIENLTQEYQINKKMS